ncbi:MAG: hypothetical protein M3Y84_02650 [Acidobacteriota bacterium]|nr:hypothetical protein [Acidobacteriota bacterium]
MVLNGILIGAAIAAFILFFFGDGWAMEFYLAGEGAVFGGVMGGVAGLLMHLVSQRQKNGF